MNFELFEILFCSFMVYWGTRFLIVACGKFGIAMVIGIVVFVMAFSDGKSNGVLLGIVLVVIPLIWAAVKSMDTPNGRRQVKKYTEQIEETEKEYGIIDFSEKEK